MQHTSKSMGSHLQHAQNPQGRVCKNHSCGVGALPILWHARDGGFPKLGGTFLKVPITGTMILKLGSILVSPYFGKLPDDPGPV